MQRRTNVDDNSVWRLNDFVNGSDLEVVDVSLRVSLRSFGVGYVLQI